MAMSMCLSRATAAAPPRASSSSSSSSMFGSGSSSSMVLTKVPKTSSSTSSSSKKTNKIAFVAPAPAKPKVDKGPSGASVLLQTLQKGKEKAEKEGIKEVLADVRDGISQRNYDGPWWPEAAEARRKMECPRCGASTADAVAAAEAAGRAAAGQHPLGWCKECAENNKLIDVSGGF